MKIEVTEIKKQIGSKLKFHNLEAITLKELDYIADVDVNIEVNNAGSRLIVLGTLTTAIEMSCSRCAEKFFQDIQVPVSEQFLPEESPEIKEKKEFNLSDLSVFTFSEDEIDMEEAIRQNIYSALPLQPLCSKECKGLCPTCGENLNITQCKCPTEEFDPRLAPLLKFKDQS